MRRRRRIIAGVITAVVLLLLCTGAVLGYHYWNKTYIILYSEQYRRDITELDLHGQPLQDLEKLPELTQLKSLDLTDTGLTTEQYLQLQSAMPDCTILWSIPFQDQFLPLDTKVISITNLTEADVQQLQYFKQLETIDASQCYDYDTLLLLKQTYPNVTVGHTVIISGTEYPLTVMELEIENADPVELNSVLPHLKYLSQVRFTGKTPGSEQIYQWKEAYPNTTFVWSFEVCGVPATSLDTELFLNNIPMRSVEEVESALKYFYNLTWVEMCKCDIPSEEMDALGKRHPETRFIWTVYVGKCELRTDVKAFMPWKFGHRTADFNDSVTGELKYCVDIICMDLGHMWVSDYSFLEYMPNMQYLIIADTKGKDFSMIPKLTELRYLEMFITNITDLNLLTGLTKLEDLNLSYTYPSDYEPLTKMTWLKNLWLVGPSWRLSYADRQMLREGLPDTYIQFAGKGSVCGHWRRLPNYFIMRDLLGMPYYRGDEE